MILNARKDKIPRGAIWVDRRSKLGNPFVIGRDGNRDQVCDKYEAWLRQQILAGRVTLEELALLHGQTLVCWCVPERCHALTIQRAAEFAANGVLF